MKCAKELPIIPMCRLGICLSHDEVHTTPNNPLKDIEILDGHLPTVFVSYTVLSAVAIPTSYGWRIFPNSRSKGGSCHLFMDARFCVYHEAFCNPNFVNATNK